MAKAKRERSILNPYRSYVLRDGKDPAIFAIKTMVQDAGVSEAQLHVLSNVSTTTFANWFRGETLRPQHATLAAVAGALGCEWVLQKTKDINFEKELPRALAWQEHYKAQRAQAARR